MVDLRQAAQGGRPASIILEPGDESTIHHIIVVRRGTYDLIKSDMVAVSVKTAEFGGNNGRRVRVDIVRQRTAASS